MGDHGVLNVKCQIFAGAVFCRVAFQKLVITFKIRMGVAKFYYFFNFIFRTGSGEAFNVLGKTTNNKKNTRVYFSFLEKKLYGNYFYYTNIALMWWLPLLLYN